MKKLFLLIFGLSLFYKISYSQDTFSIIAVDTETGEVGAAGATCLFDQDDGIIELISSIIPGKGGIMSQGYVCIPNINLINGIEQMNNGLSPDEIIDWLIENDQCNAGSFNFRQYGIIDFDNNGEVRTAGFTGPMADNYKEDRQGNTYSIQGNILLDQSVIDNMETNFNTSNGGLKEKLMAAMQGANLSGADSRCLEYGTSSATAFLIVYQADDVIGEPSFELNIASQEPGTEPIDLLQEMFNNSLSLEVDSNKDIVRLFPNPTENIIRLNTSKIYNIEVYDIKGSIILSTRGTSINIQSLDKGTYIARLKDLELSTTSSYKIIKE